MTDFEYEIDEDEVMRGFDRQEAWAKHVLRDFVDDLADRGIEILRVHAPAPGNPVAHPYSEGVLQERIDRTDVGWRPGGAGGGGAYTATFGVKEGWINYPLYVDQGTGIYGYKGAPYRAYGGRLMNFYASRLQTYITKRTVKGQQAQHFMYATWRDLALYAEYRLMSSHFKPGI